MAKVTARHSLCIRCLWCVGVWHSLGEAVVARPVDRLLGPGQYCNWVIELRVEHIPGKLNVMADAVSRNLLQVMETSDLERHPGVVPGVVVEKPYWLQPTWRSLLIASLTKASLQAQRTYAVGQHQYQRFCGDLGVPPLPASEQVLILLWQTSHRG